MLLTMKEYAEKVGVSYGSVRAAIHRGILPFEKKYGKTLVNSEIPWPCRKKEMHRKKEYKDKRLYGIWSGMKQRCHNEKHPRYYQYGGRGIKVCDEWRTNYNEFAKWSLSHGYADDLQIDRIDNDDGYRPENCRWVTRLENAQNKRPYHTTLKNPMQDPMPDGYDLVDHCYYWNLSPEPICTLKNGRIVNELYPDGTEIEIDDNGERRVIHYGTYFDKKS